MRISNQILLPLFAAAFLLSSSSGCRQKTAVPVTAPVSQATKLKADSAPMAITPKVSVMPVSEPVEPITKAKVAAPPSSLDLGEANYQARKYANAARLFEAYLQKNPTSSDRDMVLFRLGMSLALADNSTEDMRRAEQTLKRLVAEYPASPFREPAEAILYLQSQIESLKADLKEKDAKLKLLSEELQKLKEIDLQRRPSSPSY